VGHLGGDVDGVAALVQQVEIVGKALPSPPGHPHAERRAGDVLHPFHEVDQDVGVGGPDGGETHPAIAHHQRRHPVGGRRLQNVVPGDLAVVVGVDVDPPRGHERPVGLDDLPGRFGDHPDLDDPAVPDSDVGRVRRTTTAVHDGSALDGYIEHISPLSTGPCRLVPRSCPQRRPFDDSPPLFRGLRAPLRRASSTVP